MGKHVDLLIFRKSYDSVMDGKYSIGAYPLNSLVRVESCQNLLILAKKCVFPRPGGASDQVPDNDPGSGFPKTSLGGSGPDISIRDGWRVHFPVAFR
jgi:hypothetical protein